MDDFATAFAVVGGITLANSLVFFVPLWGPQLAFLRLTPPPAVEGEKTWPSFSLTDGLVLTAFLAIANALSVAAFKGERDKTYLPQLAICANFLAFLLWFKCQRFMRKYGILQPRSRLLFQVVVYPMSVIVISGLLTSGLVLVESIELLPQGVDVALSHPLVIAGAVALVLSIVALRAVRFAFRRYVLPSACRVSTAEVLNVNDA